MPFSNPSNYSPAVKTLLSLLALSTGGFMIFDGIRKLVVGSYFGRGLGPWARLVSMMGIDPMSMAVPFILLGITWLVFLLPILAGRVWGRKGGLAVAVFSLWYLPLGTLFALAYIFLLLRYR